MLDATMVSLRAVFVYPMDQDSVLLVEPADYNACNTSSYVKRFDDGDTVRLQRAGADGLRASSSVTVSSSRHLHHPAAAIVTRSLYRRVAAARQLDLASPSHRFPSHHDAERTAARFVSPCPELINPTTICPGRCHAGTMVPSGSSLAPSAHGPTTTANLTGTPSSPHPTGSKDKNGATLAVAMGLASSVGAFVLGYAMLAP
ncbi:hypothetical protein BAE44_0019759 [Dichanthelium oligosanthes]|uniref:Phytocyanin domain-containing protein n=1 Tax=Dichanthelium oligosanthes TaxID=888268 RepID=A0A1E5V237_9POAL|nr:hypothetical protein BAE44_0019759 [Dichanthelium oligosanthes]